MTSSGTKVVLMHHGASEHDITCVGIGLMKPGC